MRKLLVLIVVCLAFYSVLNSGQFGGIPSAAALAYLLWRAAPGIGRDFSKLWSVLRGRRKLSSIIYSRGSYM